jgi:hypothetical protein
MENASALTYPAPIRVMHVIDKLGVGGSSVHGITQLLAQSIPMFDPEQFEFTVCSLRQPEPAGDVLKKASVRLEYPLPGCSLSGLNGPGEGGTFPVHPAEGQNSIFWKTLSKVAGYSCRYTVQASTRMLRLQVDCFCPPKGLFGT